MADEMTINLSGLLRMTYEREYPRIQISGDHDSSMVELEVASQIHNHLIGPEHDDFDAPPGFYEYLMDEGYVEVGECTLVLTVKFRDGLRTDVATHKPLCADPEPEPCLLCGKPSVHPNLQLCIRCREVRWALRKAGKRKEEGHAATDESIRAGVGNYFTDDRWTNR